MSALDDLSAALKLSRLDYSPWWPCNHARWTGVDQTPIEDPVKVWKCDGCDLESVTPGDDAIRTESVTPVDDTSPCG